MERNLVFSNTVSLDRFKSLNNVLTINIVKNPKTSKVFFACPEDSSLTGRIAKAIDYNKPLFVSNTTDQEGEVVPMLHNRKESTENIMQVL